MSVADVSVVSAADLASVMRKASRGEAGSFEAAVKRVMIMVRPCIKHAVLEACML